MLFHPAFLIVQPPAVIMSDNNPIDFIAASTANANMNGEPSLKMTAQRSLNESRHVTGSQGVLSTTSVKQDGSVNETEISSPIVNRVTLTFADVLESKVQFYGKNPTATVDVIETKDGTKKPSRILQRHSEKLKAILFSPDSANIVPNAEIIEKICDLKKCEFKDPELEKEFVEANVRKCVHRIGVLALMVVSFEVVTQTVFLIRFGISWRWSILVSTICSIIYHSVIGGLSIWSTSRATDRAVKLMRLIYKYTALEILIWLGWALVGNLVLYQATGFNITTPGGAVLNMVISTFQIAIVAFICVQVVYHHRVIPQVMAFIGMFLVTVVLRMIVNPNFAAPGPVLVALASGATALKTLVVSGIFKYRQRISERLLFFHERVGVSASDESGENEKSGQNSNWLQRMKQRSQLFTPSDFNLFHDESRRPEIYRNVLLILVVDAVLSLVTFALEKPEVWTPSLIKFAILVVLTCVYHLFFKWTIDLKGRRMALMFNIVSVSMIVLDGLAFFMDAVWTLPLLGPDDGIYVCSKPVNMLVTLAVNMIGSTCSGLRLPWATTVNIVSFVITVSMFGSYGVMFPKFNRVTVQPYFFGDVLILTIEFTIILMVVLFLEGRYLNKLYYKAYKNLADYQNKMGKPKANLTRTFEITETAK